MRVSVSTHQLKVILMLKFTKIQNSIGLKYSKSKKMYEKTNRLVEKWCKIAYFVIVKMSVPGFILPKALVSLFIYYTTDSGPDAFELPIPVW